MVQASGCPTPKEWRILIIYNLDFKNLKWMTLVTIKACLKIILHNPPPPSNGSRSFTEIKKTLFLNIII
jgi:hypothetical protein